MLMLVNVAAIVVVAVAQPPIPGFALGEAHHASMNVVSVSPSASLRLHQYAKGAKVQEMQEQRGAGLCK
jgi:hypothetical protein